MFIRFYSPTPALRGLVRAYMVNHIQTVADSPLYTSPFPPAPEQTLLFYPRDPMSRFSHRTGKVNQQPACIIVGPQVSRVDITMGNNHLIVAVFFEPGGLHNLIGMPMRELFDDSIDGTLLWKHDIEETNEQLNETDSYDQMQQIVEALILRLWRRKQPEQHPIESVFQRMLDFGRPVSLDYLADQACLSPRQFERKFQERLGVGPTTFRRIIRFSRAFRLKESQPDMDWLDVALHCGYYDFRHLVRDFREYANTTPTLLLQEELRTSVRPYTSFKS